MLEDKTICGERHDSGVMRGEGRTSCSGERPNRAMTLWTSRAGLVGSLQRAQQKNTGPASRRTRRGSLQRGRSCLPVARALRYHSVSSWFGNFTTSHLTQMSLDWSAGRGEHPVLDDRSERNIRLAEDGSAICTSIHGLHLKTTRKDITARCGRDAIFLTNIIYFSA